jgi:hypothetical protein
LANVLQALEAAQPPDPCTIAVLDRGAFQAALRALAKLLRQADMAATEAMEALQRRFGGVLGAALDPMADAIGALDFELALRLCLLLSQDSAGEDEASSAPLP